MSEKPNEAETKVTLDDLLKVKRAERPSEQFWDKFDQELHQRMLQTLVQKDPLYVQIMRGLTGRFAQMATVAGLAAVIVLAAGRFMIDSSTPAASPETFAEVSEPEQTAVAISTATTANLTVASLESSRSDYAMGGIEETGLSQTSGLKRDFGLDSLHVANYDSSAYSGDVAGASLAFVNTSVASLVY